jgi:hypothetical protein
MILLPYGAASVAAGNDLPVKPGIKGRVEKSDVGDSNAIVPTNQIRSQEELALALKAAANSTRPLESALDNVVSEVTRQQYVSVGQPNVVGTMVIPARPGMIPIGDYLPPREQYMTIYAAQIQASLIKLVEQVSVLPEDSTDVQLNQQIIALKSALEFLRTQNQPLQASMAGSPYNNLAVGKDVLNMLDRLKEIKKSIKSAESRAKKVGRDLKRAN